MTALVWDKPSDRRFERGVDRGVLFPLSGPGVAWNGLVSVDETPSGGELQSYWFDGVKYLDDVGSEDYEATLTAFTYPDEFEACNGAFEVQDGVFATGQFRDTFNLCYRTLLGDAEDPDAGYKLHFVYSATATPTQRHYGTISDEIDLTNLSWTIAAVPPKSSTFKPTAHVFVDSTKVPAYGLRVLENYIYGSDAGNPTWPTQAQVMNLLLTEPLSETDLVTSLVGEFI